MSSKTSKPKAKQQHAKSKRVARPAKSKRRSNPSTISGSGDYHSGSGWGKWAQKAGGLGGDFLSHIFGMGDYSLKYNSLMNAGGPPQFSNNKGDRSTVIRHREYVTDIISSTGFVITPYTISVDNSFLFPWLSSLATNFEQYRIHGLIFEFKSTAGSAVSSTNNSLGTVIMATQYDVLEVAFQNKLSMENYEYATSCSAAESMIHGVECKPSLTVAPELYVDTTYRAGTSADLRLSQFGQFNLATTGMQAAGVTIGELWVSYEIELLKPRLGAGTAVSSIFLFSNSVASSNFFGATVSYSNAGSSHSGVSLPTSGVNSVFGNFTFNNTTLTLSDPRLAGREIVVTCEITATTVASPPTVTNVTNGTVDSTIYSFASAASGASQVAIFLNPNATNTWVLTFFGPTSTGAAVSNLTMSIAD